jgi:hypothetical protein
MLQGKEREMSKVHQEHEAILVNGGSGRWFMWRYEMWRWFDAANDLPGCSQYRPLRFPYARRFCDLPQLCPQLSELLQVPDAPQSLYDSASAPLLGGDGHGNDSDNDNDNDSDNDNDRKGTAASRRIDSPTSTATYSVQVKQQLFGENLISIPVPNVITLLVSEVLHPFYLFQVFSVALWFFEDYWVYAIAIVVMSVLSAVTSVVQTRRNLIDLRNLAEFHCQVQVWRDRNWGMCQPINAVPPPATVANVGNTMLGNDLQQRFHPKSLCRVISLHLPTDHNSHATQSCSMANASSTRPCSLASRFRS